MKDDSPLLSLRKVNVDVPKNLFTYWHQGSQQMPEFASVIAALWQKLNPDWTLYIFDKENVKPWLTDEQNTFLELATIPKIAHYSDMIRTYLLLNHGGVWFDVTLLPLRPLDYWDFDLGELSAYKYESKDYMPSVKNVGRRGENGSPVINFFLAAQKDSYYLQQMSKMLEFYVQTTLPNSRPYLYWQYEFDQLILTDSRFQEWFHDSSTGTTIHTACNLIDGGYSHLETLIQKRNAEICSACVKLGLRDSRRFRLKSLDLSGYYTYIGIDVSEIRFSEAFARPRAIATLILFLILLLIIIVCLVRSTPRLSLNK